MLAAQCYGPNWSKPIPSHFHQGKKKLLSPVNGSIWLIVSSRAIKQIQSLQAAVDQFPDANEDQTDTFALLDKMRAKFRVVTSVLKVEQKFSTAQNSGMSY